MDQATAPAENAETTGNTRIGMLRNLCDNGFDGSLNAAALVLGREPDELRAMLDECDPVDEDLVVKIRGIAAERGIDIETS